MCISETLYGFVRDFVDVGPRQALALKGKSVPVYAYTVKGLKPGLTLGVDLLTMPIEEVRRRVYEAGGELADEGSIYALEAGVAAG